MGVLKMNTDYTQPIAIYRIFADMGIEILKIECGIDDRIIYRYSGCAYIHKARIYETARGRMYIRTPTGRIHLDECMRC